MIKSCVTAPYVIYGNNPNGSERYAVFTNTGVLVYTDSPRDASRFATARSAYDFAGQKKDNSATFKYRVLQDFRVGRRTY
jgi:hypothetical protein